MKPIYIASPYSHPDPQIRHLRFIYVNLYVAELIHRTDIIPISPIALSHPLVVLSQGKVPNTHAFWRPRNRAIITICEELWVLKLPGWDESVGIRTEVEDAYGLGIPVYRKDWTLPDRLPELALLEHTEGALKRAYSDVLTMMERSSGIDVITELEHRVKELSKY